MVINVPHAIVSELRINVPVVELAIDLHDGADWAAAIRQAISTRFRW